jgi:hypothetical protein
VYNLKPKFLGLGKIILILCLLAPTVGSLMNSMGNHGSSSLPFVMKVMVCHFVSDSPEVIITLIVMLSLIVVLEISLQLHEAF